MRARCLSAALEAVVSDRIRAPRAPAARLTSAFCVAVSPRKERCRPAMMESWADFACAAALAAAVALVLAEAALDDVLTWARRAACARMRSCALRPTVSFIAARGELPRLGGGAVSDSRATAISPRGPPPPVYESMADCSRVLRA